LQHTYSPPHLYAPTTRGLAPARHPHQKIFFSSSRHSHKSSGLSASSDRVSFSSGRELQQTVVYASPRFQGLCQGILAHAPGPAPPHNQSTLSSAMHHQRRKSGQGSGNTSMTDVRKAVSASRPSATRRTTPQSALKLGRNPRDRERELEDELWWDEERESFPNYWYVPLHQRLRFIITLPPNSFLFGVPAGSPDMQVICATLEECQ
jgi:hypothetical protein